MTVVTAEHLTALHTKLSQYVDPDNRDGFFRVFAGWVAKAWQEAAFFETEVCDTGYDCSTRPRETGSALNQRVLYYRDFIDANTGQTVAAYESGHGLCCETMDARLCELYGDACRKVVEDYIDEHGLTLPEGADTHWATTVAEAIFSEAFDHKTRPELYRASDAIVSEFGQLGFGVAPYTCPCWGPGPEDRDDNYFGAWTLADFKKATTV